MGKFNHILYSYLIFISCLINGIRSLKLTDFLVPDHAVIGSTVTLKCYFDVAFGTLNSVKWYKNEHEFFRYSPSISDIIAFPADGVIVDLNSSDKNKVTLKEINFNSSGLYKCEVSTDLPDFKIAFDSKNMSVVAYPEWGPVITDVAEKYSVGQTITANCSVAPSYPSPTLSWEINGRPVDSWDVSDKEVPGPGKLSSRRSTLQFIAEDQHFEGSNQALNIRCRAKLGTLTSSTLETTFTSTLAQSPDSLESALQRYRNTGAMINGTSHNITAVILLFLLFITRKVL
ncbi:uncharacterized protein LOC142327515 [Lycorma delicatula]|uniref:uncharacterized protein LOC142327515 n=1 Tax=Lycorma delicatula TaxID=130591 RepID=UPI003F510C00